MDALHVEIVLVTAGTGSFGQWFISTLLVCRDIRRLVVVSCGELEPLEIAQAEPFRDRSDRLRYFLGDVGDAARLGGAMK